MNNNINDNARDSATQCNKIAAWLSGGHTITSLEALRRFNCMRLASRICDLRDRGLAINTRKVKTHTGKWVTEYYM